MRTFTLAVLAAGLTLAGCSERTQDNAEEMVESAAVYICDSDTSMPSRRSLSR